MTSRTIEVGLPYQPLYDPNNHQFIENTPRLSGKTHENTMLSALWIARYRQCDVMYCRATSEAIGESIYNEMQEKLDIVGVKYKATKSPYHIRTEYGNEIHFKGLDGNMNRTKGNKPKNKYSVIIVDECQEIRNEVNLRQAISSFIRHVDTSVDWKIIYSGNPSEIRSHWWNTWTEKSAASGKYTVIKANYKNLLGILPKEVVELIELDFLINPQLARFMYLGDISDLAGGAYPSFRRDKHLVTPQEAGKIFSGETIQTVIFGGDGAIKNDATAITPLAVMSSGRACVLERFIYDPIRTGRPLAPVQYSALIQKYFRWMERKYNFRDNGVNIYTPIDCAATDLIMQLNYDLPDYYNIVGFTDKKVIQNTAVLNSAFSRNMIYIIDYGGYYDWENWNEADRDPPLIPTDTDILCQQLESVVWKNNKLDPSIPNDVSDSLVYGAQYFVNPDNYQIYLPQKEIRYA